MSEDVQPLIGKPVPADILVIDSDAQGMRDCLEAFSARGWRVKHVETFLDGLRVLGETTFDVVITDMTIPDMPGTEAWGYIHKMHPAVIGIMTTSSPSLHRSINALGEGAAAYLLKPLNARSLCNFIQELIEQRHEDDQLTRLEQHLSGLLNLFSALEQSNSMERILETTLTHLGGFLHYDVAVLDVLGPHGERYVQQHSYIPSLGNTKLTQEQVDFVRSVTKKSLTNHATICD